LPNCSFEGRSGAMGAPTRVRTVSSRPAWSILVRLKPVDAGDDAFVFASGSGGKPISYWNFHGRGWRKALEAAGCQAGKSSFCGSQPRASRSRTAYPPSLSRACSATRTRTSRWACMRGSSTRAMWLTASGKHRARFSAKSSIRLNLSAPYIRPARCDDARERPTAKVGERPLDWDVARAVSSVGRAPARQAGGHWFEPSTAHRKSLLMGNFRFQFWRRNCHGATTSENEWAQRPSPTWIHAGLVLPSRRTSVALAAESPVVGARSRRCVLVLVTAMNLCPYMLRCPLRRRDIECGNDGWAPRTRG
jgi:hypothetical protein